jgi:hypothetical protein
MSKSADDVRGSDKSRCVGAIVADFDPLAVAMTKNGTVLNAAAEFPGNRAAYRIIPVENFRHPVPGCILGLNRDPQSSSHVLSPSNEK